MYSPIFDAPPVYSLYSLTQSFVETQTKKDEIKIETFCLFLF